MNKPGKKTCLAPCLPAVAPLLRLTFIGQTSLNHAAPISAKVSQKVGLVSG